jgi:hypothetical protein
VVLEPPYLELDLRLLTAAQLREPLLLLLEAQGVPGGRAVCFLVAHGDLVVRGTSSRVLVSTPTRSVLAVG